MKKKEVAKFVIQGQVNKREPTAVNRWFLV